MFGRFLCRLRDDMAHVPEVPLIWCRYAILFFSLSLLLEFNVNPLKFSNQPLQFLFPSHLVYVFWITILFYFE